MPAEDFLTVTEQLKERYDPAKVMIVITGGEPLVRKDLELIGKRLSAQGYPWGFVTNGYALGKARLQSLIDSGLRSITISLDGFEEEHNWLRGNSKSYERALNAVSLIGRTSNLVSDIVTCVNQRNIDQLDKLKEQLISLGIKKWRLFTIFPKGRAKENEELELSPGQFRKVMEFIAETRKEGRIMCSYGCEGYLGGFENEVRDGYFFCRAGINIGSVLADGSVSACPNIDHRLAQGNIYEKPFLEIWDKSFQKMRDRSWTKTGKCENCKEFKYCKGNGMHLRDMDNGDVIKCHYDLLKLSEQ